MTSRSSSSRPKPNLAAITSTVSKALGDLVLQSATNTEGVWFKLKRSMVPDLKSAIQGYIKANNNFHRTRFQAHFPKPFVFRISEREPERPR